MHTDIGTPVSLLDLPASVLEQVALALPGNAKKSLRAACRELRAVANATTGFLRINLSHRLEPIPSSLLDHLSTVQLDIPWHWADIPCIPEALTALDIQAVRRDCTVKVAVSVDSGEKEQCRLASIHFALLVDCLKTAHIWSRVTELHCSCERWLGPEIAFGPRVRVHAHLRLSDRDARLNRKLLKAMLSQENLAELTISDMLPHDLDGDLVHMLNERWKSLQRLTLRACELTEHDPDIPLIFDLSPLAQASLPRLTHFSLDSAYEGLVTMAGMPALLSAERLPALRCVTLSGLSLVPFSSLPNHNRAARYRSLQLRAMPAEFAAFHGLSELELSASHLGNLARLSALPGLERLVLRSLGRRSIRAYPAQLTGHEIAQLPWLRDLVLDCIECPNGLQSKSLERLELINTSLQHTFALIGPGCPPRLATIFMQQMSHGHRNAPDPDAARMYTGLMMMSKLGPCQLAEGMICPGAGLTAGNRAGVLVSTKEGAWEFGDPQPAFEDVPDDGCVWQAVPDFSFRLYRRGL